MKRIKIAGIWSLVLLFTLIQPNQNLLAQPENGERERSEKEDNGKEEEKEKAFSDIITDEAESMEGMLTVHKVKNKHYFEIPDSVFGRDIMAITRKSKTPAGAGYGGEQANRQVIRFEKGPNKNVFIRIISYLNVSTDSLSPLFQAVQNSNVNPIAAAFDIEAERQDTSVLIEVEDFFNQPNQAFDLPPITKQRYKIKSLQKDRSYIESIRSYPINVEVRSVKTYTVDPPRLRTGNNNQPDRTITLQSGVAAGVVTFEINTSMILLPKEPMRKRFFDPRVGIFANRYTVFDEGAQRSKMETFTVRWRLEPKNETDAREQQSGELIEPKKPIVFYIDPATPKKYVPYLKQGVEDWQPAFEQAGWKNAILAKDWPEDDPTMSLEDARFSVIRYFASTIQNAYGPNVHDPRSGEIIESKIGWFHNITKLLKRWYTTQTAAVDARARVNEFDMELMGELVRFVSAHEVGHTIGLRHNFGASHATPVEMLRDKAFTDKNGHTSSIMDYARFNYVAQPEDGVTDLMPRVGDYDKWAIEWNYKPIYGTKDAYEDKIVLNELYKTKAENNQRLHFLTETSPYDPRANREDVGDNSMLASEYGIKNLKRILPNAIDWTKEDAEHYQMADELYSDVIGQFRRYMGHVSKWVGGIFDTPKTYDQEGVVYEPAPAAMQRDAVAFLNKHLFQTPNWLLQQDIMNRLRPDHGVVEISKIQQNTFNSLLNVNRLQRLIETKSSYPDAYGIDNLYNDLYHGIWTELRSGARITTNRRNLQKIYVDKMIKMLSPKESPPRQGFFAVRSGPSMNPELTDMVSISRAYLKKLHSSLEKNAKKSKDSMSRYHLEDCLYRVGKALDLED